MRAFSRAAWSRAAPLTLVCALAPGACQQIPTDLLAPRPPVEVRAWTEQGYVGQRISTPHFELHTTLGDEEFVQFLPGFLEQAYAHYESTAPPPGPLDRPLKVYLFRNRGEWEHWTRQHYPRRYPAYRRIRSGAYTHHDVAVAYFLRRDRTLAVLAHEGFHQYATRHFGETLPAWLNEGLACLTEAFVYEGNRIRFTPQRNDFRINALREGLARQRLLPLREMLATHAGQVIASPDNRAYIYYAQAWAMTCFLKYGPHEPYRRGFERLISELGTERYRVGVNAVIAATPTPDGRPIPFGEAVFRRYITEDLDAFESRMKAYIHQLAAFE